MKDKESTKKRTKSVVFRSALAVLLVTTISKTRFDRTVVSSGSTLGAEVWTRSIFLVGCRILPFLHGVTEVDRKVYDIWLGEHVEHSASKRRNSITSVENVAFQFKIGVGSLFPLQELSEPEVKCDIDVIGPVITHRDWWLDTRSHFIYEQLPVIAWIRKLMEAVFVDSPDSPRSPTNTKVLHKKRILLDNIPAQREFLQFFDPEFEEKVLWVSEGQTVCIHGKLYVPVYRIDSSKDTSNDDFRTASWKAMTLEGRPQDGRSFGNPIFYQLAREWIAERAEKIVDRRSEPIVLYHVRGLRANARVMDVNNDQMLIQSLERKLTECGRKEKLVLFTGQNEEGEELSQKEQFLLFHSASLFVGPHGGAVASILFMFGGKHSRHHDCDLRPQVLEYIPGPRSGHVHWAFASYYSLYFGAPWTEYHLIQFLANSTHETTYVGVEEWRTALDAVFSGNRCPAVFDISERRERLLPSTTLAAQVE